jgi:hypothetical protein
VDASRLFELGYAKSVPMAAMSLALAVPSSWDSRNASLTGERPAVVVCMCAHAAAAVSGTLLLV